jgi:hypothetical protein
MIAQHSILVKLEASSVDSIAKKTSCLYVRRMFLRLGFKLMGTLHRDGRKAP